MDATRTKFGLFSSRAERGRRADLEKAVRILELSERDLKTRLEALTKVATKLRAERDASLNSEELRRVYGIWIDALFEFYRAATADVSTPGSEAAQTDRLFKDQLNDNESFRKKVVELSGMFDAAYYRDRNRDLRLKDEPPLDHYLRIGGLEGRPAGPTFDSQAYLTDNPDVAGVKINPLLHYLIYGFKEGRRFVRPTRHYRRDDTEAGEEI